jgi:hypothetical protein
MRFKTDQFLSEPPAVAAGSFMLWNELRERELFIILYQLLIAFSQRKAFFTE